jgi:hypothetical protein
MTAWGRLPRWKARALALAEIQTVINDAVVQQKRADAAQRKQAAAVEARRRADAQVHAAKRHQYYQDLYARLDAAEARCDALLDRERAKARARQALADAEAKYTSPPSADDVDGMTMN